MLLGDLGAEVIRVENPFVLPPTTKGYQARPAFTDNLGYLGSGYGPAAPGRPDRPWNRHSLNNSICRNKLSCTIDTRRPEGSELLLRLVEQCDVFVENFKASGLNRMGISVERAAGASPGPGHPPHAAGGHDGRLVVLCRVRGAVRRPDRIPVAVRAPRFRPHDQPGNHLHGRGQRAGGRLRGYGRPALPRRDRTGPADRAGPERERHQPPG